MGKITGVLMFILAIGSVLLFMGQKLIFGSVLWWFPVGISEHAAAIDAQLAARWSSWESRSLPRRSPLDTP